jgi:hypothetical protein
VPIGLETRLVNDLWPIGQSVANRLPSRRQSVTNQSHDRLWADLTAFDLCIFDFTYIFTKKAKKTKVKINKKDFFSINNKY